MKHREMKNRECRSIEHKRGTSKIVSWSLKRRGKKKWERRIMYKNFPKLMKDFYPVNPWEYKNK